MTLDRIMFDNVRYLLFNVTVGCVRAKESLFSHILDDAAMHIEVKWNVSEFIGR